jgi:hypothetical protein
MLTDEERRTLSEHYQDIRKQVHDAFTKKAE